MKLIAPETWRSRCWPPTSQLFENKLRRYRKVNPASVPSVRRRASDWLVVYVLRAVTDSSVTANEPDGGKHVAIADKA